jgi:hypothetical protein
VGSTQPILIAAGVARPLESEPWATWAAVMMIASMATLVQSYVVIKLIFLALFLLVSLGNIYLTRTRIVVYPRLVWFYAWTGIAGIVWAIVGLLHQANHFQGIVEALRLYVVWSAAFVVLFTLLRSVKSLQVMHNVMVAAGILIPLINFVGLYDQYSGLGLISEGVRQELDMNVAFRDGFIQITSQNIDVMFLIVPYLLSVQFRVDASKSNTMLTKLALVLSLVLVAVSGRRALWLVVVLTPFTILLLSALADSHGLIKVGGRRFLLGCAAVTVVGLGALLIVPESRLDVGSISRLKEAFSSEDYRTIQKPYLIAGFMESPVFGSGFGAAARYIRDDERPWAGYELTYYQMLFNLGIVGVTALGALFSLYFAKVVWLLREFKDGSAVPFGLLVAYCSFFIGAYSNRYFGSFDLLFFVGLLPYLSTFRGGFEGPRSIARVSA